MTRSEGSSNLAEYHKEIGKFERANKKKKKLAEQREAEMAHAGQGDNVLPPEEAPHDGDNGREELEDPPPPAAFNPRPAPVRRTLRDHDAPNHQMYRGGVQHPPINRNDFEIKPGLLALVKQNQFHGLPSENPVYHLDNFEDVCSTTRMNGVPDDAVKCRLFSFSLSDKAHRWFKSLEIDSIRTWDEYKAAFLGKYFTQARTTLLRNKISTFRQGATESFHEAWERFKDYKRECPHHGFTPESLINTFYRGIEEKYKMALDTASNGDFMTKTEEEAQVLIENLAASNSNHCVDYDRTLRGGGTGESKQIADLTAKVEQLLRRDQRPMNYCEDSGDGQAFQEQVRNGFDDLQAELNYVNGQGNYQNKGFDQNYRNHPNLSYRNTNVENPQDQTYPAPMRPQSQQYQPRQFVPNQGGFNKPFENKGEAQGIGYRQGGFQQRPQFNNFQGSYQAPAHVPSNNAPAFSSGDSEMKMMMQQILEGQKKNASDINVKVENMYSDLQGKFETLSSHAKSLDNQVAQISFSPKRSIGSLPGKPEVNSKEFCNVIFTSDSKMVENEEAIKEISRLLYGSNVDDLVIKSEVEGKFSTKEEDMVTKSIETKVTSRVEPPPYEPPLPFPSQVLTKAKKKILSSFKANMSRVGAPLPHVNDLSQVPLYFKFIEAILANQEKVEEVMKVLKPPSTPPLEPKSLTKLGNPGTFTISCSLGDLEIDNALCDSGASVNVMSFEMAERLGIKEMKQHSSSITFGDASSKPPLGLIEDYPLKVGDCLIPTDFLVVDREKPDKLPLILGTPFLNTAGANIDFPNRRVILIHVDSKVSYQIKPSSTTFCGTIANEEMERKEKLKGLIEKNRLKDCDDKFLYHGESLNALFDEPKMVDPRKKLKKGKKPHFGHNSSSIFTLHPLSHNGGAIECKIKSKGPSKPFAKARIILLPGLEENQSDYIKELMVKVLKIELTDWGPNFKDGVHSTTPILPSV